MSESFESRDPDDDEWLIALTRTDSGPLFIRLNTTAKEFLGYSELNVKLGFAIPMQNDSGTNFPDPEENEALASVEDLICQTVSEGATGIHVLTLTNAVMKELVFYIQEGADIGGMHQHLMTSVNTHEIQCMAVREPDWDSYLEFSPE